MRRRSAAPRRSSLRCSACCRGCRRPGSRAGPIRSLEHSANGNRAILTSWTLSGTQAGAILATLVFIPVSSLPEDQLLSWGWRIPFLLSALVLLVAYLVRRTMPAEHIAVFDRPFRLGSFDEGDRFRLWSELSDRAGRIGQDDKEKTAAAAR